MMPLRSLLALVPFVVPLLLPVRAQADDRQLVELPPMMQEHMLSNMRDHLRALEDILAALAAGDVAKAGEIAEGRIGMSSLTLHGAEHMGPYMPEAMRQIGTSLHKISSRFAVAAANAEVEGTVEAQRAVYAALKDITEACNACHIAYRIR